MIVDRCSGDALQPPFWTTAVIITCLGLGIRRMTGRAAIHGWNTANPADHIAAVKASCSVPPRSLIASSCSHRALPPDPHEGAACLSWPCANRCVGTRLSPRQSIAMGRLEEAASSALPAIYLVIAEQCLDRPRAVAKVVACTQLSGLAIQAKLFERISSDNGRLFRPSVLGSKRAIMCSEGDLCERECFIGLL